MVADIVADMEVHMVAEMKVDKVTNKVADMATDKKNNGGQYGGRQSGRNFVTSRLCEFFTHSPVSVLNSIQNGTICHPDLFGYSSRSGRVIAQLHISSRQNRFFGRIFSLVLFFLENTQQLLSEYGTLTVDNIGMFLPSCGDTRNSVMGVLGADTVCLAIFINVLNSLEK